MGRISIASRLVLIIVGAIILVQMLMAAVFLIEYRRNADWYSITPLLTQIASVTQAIERVRPEDRELVVRAASGQRIEVELHSGAPAGIIRSERFAERETRLREMIGPPSDRLIAMSLVSSPRRGGGEVTRLRDLVGSRIRAVVGLSGGGYLEIEAGGELTLRIWGIPAGLIASLLGFGVALIAIVVIRRETRPLSELTGAVSRFGADIEPQPVKESGAPDLRALTRAVNAMQVRIAELVRNRTIVLGALSHDLRTYVTRLRLRMEFLPDSEQRRKAEADLNDMQALMDDALAYARASFSNASPEPVDITPIVRAECESLAAQGRNISVSGNLMPALVCGSSAGLKRIVANLANNAIAYGGSAELSLHPGNDVVELWVEDRGPGIPQSERERVFEPFYRLEASRNRDKGGAGLGLTIVRQIAESAGGSVTIEDRPGGGSRIRVVLKRPA